MFDFCKNNNTCKYYVNFTIKLSDNNLTNMYTQTNFYYVHKDKINYREVENPR